MTDGVVETPHGAHFTECVPDYPRDEAFQRAYTASAKSDEAWDEFRARYIDVTEAEYQEAVDKHERRTAHPRRGVRGRDRRLLPRTTARSSPTRSARCR